MILPRLLSRTLIDVGLIGLRLAAALCPCTEPHAKMNASFLLGKTQCCRLLLSRAGECSGGHFEQQRPPYVID